MPEEITLVTGNKHKLAEWRRMFSANVKLQSVDIDLEEIQSLDMQKIVRDKAKRAYDKLQCPVIVEDISAGIDHLGGLPGPFIKFFEEKLGIEALYIFAGKEANATIACAVAYYDGKTMLLGEGVVHGKVVPARGKNGFGFDSVFVPNGQSKTYSQMSPAEKDAISHRHLAIEDLVIKLHKHL